MFKNPYLVLLKLSSDSINRFTCRYEQLQLEVINEISFVGVDVIMIADFYQTPVVKHN
jgi:hypothetical protein